MQGIGEDGARFTIDESAHSRTSQSEILAGPARTTPVSSASVAATSKVSEAPARERDLRDLVLESWSDPNQRGWFVGTVISLLLLCMTFEVNLRHFVYAWTTDENYSHGFLVPFISLYFANLAYKRGPISTKGGVGLGLFMLAVSLFGRLVMVLLPIPFLGDLAFLLGVAGVCALIGGTQALRRYGFAIFFLIFMVPLPIALYTKFASPLQLLASQIATVVLNATGVPALCEGNMMSLPGGIQMFVAEACSGMRQLTGFLALTAAVAYLSGRPGWYRVAVILSAIPIAITANVTRVILTGYIMYFVDKQYASGTYHTLEGLLMMGFGLALLSLGRSALDQVALLVNSPPPPAVA
ncbi:exosortase/archaeosortase family protein [Singulisphaera sp. PoT]|uniref:exosortase/archaeosortase family protein n=1 Tax=Singulisphaera sp. PoT TaxID=3411797 RepID=UPI003BF4B86B